MTDASSARVQKAVLWFSIALVLVVLAIAIIVF
jgi:hypothetical protein